MTWDEKSPRDMTPEERVEALKKLDRMLALGYGLIGDEFKSTLAWVQINRRIGEIKAFQVEEPRITHHSFSNSGKDD